MQTQEPASPAQSDDFVRGSELVRWLTALTLLAILLAYFLQIYLHNRPRGDHSRGVPMAVMTAAGAAVLWHSTRGRGRLSKLTWRQYLTLAMGTGLSLQTIWAAAFPAEPVSDFLFFHESAQWFLQYGSFADADGNLLCFRQPGFTVFVAGLYSIFGPNTWAMVGANAIIFVVLIGVIGMAGRTFCDERCGRISAMLTALMPEFWAAGTLVATEMITTLGLTLSAVLAAFALKTRLRWGFLVCAGLLLGVTTYLRPNAPPLLGSIMITSFIQRRSWPKTLGATFLTMGCTIILLYPWALRNEAHFGLRVFSTQVGTNLYISYNESTDRFALAKEFLNQYPDVKDSYPIGIASAKAFIKAHPFLTVQRIVKNFYALTRRNDEMVFWSTEQSSKIQYPRWIGRWFEGVSNGLYFACIVATLIGVWKYRLFDRFPNLAVFGATFVLFHWASSLLQTQPRYHLIVLPFLILCAAPWIAGWRGSKSWGDSKQR